VNESRRSRDGVKEGMGMVERFMFDFRVRPVVERRGWAGFKVPP